MSATEYAPTVLVITFPGGHEQTYFSKNYVWDIDHMNGVVTLWERDGTTRIRISGWVSVVEFARKKSQEAKK